MEELSETRQKNRYELIGEFIARLGQRGFSKADTVEIGWIKFPVPETWNIKCNNLKIDRIWHEYYPGWLRKFVALGEKYRIFESCSWADDEEINRLMAKIKVSESMKIDFDMDFDDDQLDAVEAMDIRILSMNVTANGVKRRLEKFLKYGKMNDDLELRTPIHEGFDWQEELIPKNLTVKLIKLDEEFFDFVVHIVSGFENVHGIQDRRELHCVQLGDHARIECRVYQKPTTNFVLYPF